MSNENLPVDEWLEQVFQDAKKKAEEQIRSGKKEELVHELEDYKKTILGVAPVSQGTADIETIKVTPVQSQMESDDSELARALEEYKEAHAAKEARTQMGQESLENNLFEQVSDSIKTK